MEYSVMNNNNNNNFVFFQEKQLTKGKEEGKNRWKMFCIYCFIVHIIGLRKVNRQSKPMIGFILLLLVCSATDILSAILDLSFEVGKRINLILTSSARHH